MARAAGVSKSVVSRVVTGKGPVSSATEAKVREAMANLGYRVNPAASSLKSGRTGTVGVLLRRVASPFYSTLFAGLQEHAFADGVRVVAVTGAELPKAEGRALDSLLELGVDAMIVGSGTLSNRTIGRLADLLPTVVATRPAVETNASAIFDDPDAHAELCVQHLLAAGHAHVALLDYPGSYSARSRVEAIRRHASETGLRLRTLSGGYELEHGVTAAQELLADSRGVSALLTLSYASACGALDRFGTAGVGVPAILSVVAADTFRESNPFLPDVTGSVRDQERFTAALWEETLRRAGGADDPREVRIPVSWNAGVTLAAPPPPPASVEG